MNRVHRHLTYANVMSTIAVFLLLGGGSAMAFSAISSNSEIGPGTVSGHKPPSGKHANIVSGSITKADLASNAVTGRSLVNGSITSDKFAPTATVPHANTADSVAKLLVPSSTSGQTGAQKAAGTRAATTDSGSLVTLSVGESTTLFESPPFTVTAKCSNLGGGVYSAEEDVTSSEDGWIGGRGSLDAHAAGDVETIAQIDTDSPQTQSFPPTVVADASGAAVSIGSPVLGVHVQELVGGACMFTGYGIG
jgi:hypothetical protein